VKKQKELWYVKALPKSLAGPSTPFRFDVLAQLTNNPARITLYELLRLSKSTRDARREALADAEVFVTQIPAACEEKDDSLCHYASKQFSYITFTPEDMQVKGNHDRLLYYTGYVGSSEVSRIQVNLGSALSIISHRVMQHFATPTHRLSITQTTIYGFNTNSTHPIGKIKFRCQIGDLKFEMTCYIIDTDTSYNLLLGRPWIHCNAIVLFTLHQEMKYIGEARKVRTLIFERHSFKGIENYFTDSLLYQEFLEVDENPHPEEPISRNEADMEPEEDECLWEINPIVMSIGKLSSDTTTNVEGKWFINEDLDLVYFSIFASDSVPSDTSTNIDNDL